MLVKKQKEEMEDFYKSIYTATSSHLHQNIGMGRTTSVLLCHRNKTYCLPLHLAVNISTKLQEYVEMPEMRVLSDHDFVAVSLPREVSSLVVSKLHHLLIAGWVKANPEQVSAIREIMRLLEIKIPLDPEGYKSISESNSSLCDDVMMVGEVLPGLGSYPEVPLPQISDVRTLVSKDSGTTPNRTESASSMDLYQDFKCIDVSEDCKELPRHSVYCNFCGESFFLSTELRKHLRKCMHAVSSAPLPFKPEAASSSLTSELVVVSGPTTPVTVDLVESEDEEDSEPAARSLKETSRNRGGESPAIQDSSNGNESAELMARQIKRKRQGNKENNEELMDEAQIITKSPRIAINKPKECWILSVQNKVLYGTGDQIVIIPSGLRPAENSLSKESSETPLFKAASSDHSFGTGAKLHHSLAKAETKENHSDEVWCLEDTSDEETPLETEGDPNKKSVLGDQSKRLYAVPEDLLVSRLPGWTAEEFMGHCQDRLLEEFSVKEEGLERTCRLCQNYSSSEPDAMASHINSVHTSNSNSEDENTGLDNTTITTNSETTNSEKVPEVPAGGDEAYVGPLRGGAPEEVPQGAGAAAGPPQQELLRGGGVRPRGGRGRGHDERLRTARGRESGRTAPAGGQVQGPARPAGTAAREGERKRKKISKYALTCYKCGHKSKTVSLNKIHYALKHYKEELKHLIDTDKLSNSPYKSEQICPYCQFSAPTASLITHVASKHNMIEHFLPEKIWAEISVASTSRG